MALEQPGTLARQQACQEFSKACLHSRHCKEALTSFRSTDWPNLACKLAGHASKADKDLWHRSKPYFGTSVLVLLCSLPTHKLLNHGFPSTCKLQTYRLAGVFHQGPAALVILINEASMCCELIQETRAFLKNARLAWRLTNQQMG